MAKHGFCSLLVVIAVAAGAAAQDKDKDKVRVCHFAGSDVQLLSISRNALKAHIDHGDVEAPASVKTAADCLVPQPPPAPVAMTATTDARGAAAFQIPNTNVIARFTVTDSRGTPVGGSTAQILVIGNDYLAAAGDGGDQLAPGFAEGKLSDARPGSALTLPIAIIRLAYSTSLSGGTMLTPGPTVPVFASTHFSAADHCFTQQEVQSYVAGVCKGTLGVAKAVMFPILTGTTVTAKANSFLWSIPIRDVCDSAAQSIASRTFSGRSLPVKMRVYSPPALGNIQIFPFWFEEVGDCGGGCCVARGPQCTLVSRPENCANGSYHPLKPCEPNPCKTGACCDGQGNCTQTDEEVCRVIVKGTYHGDGTLCTPDPCRRGACCDPRTGCTVTTRLVCQSRTGSTYHGDFTSCDRISGTTPLKYTLQSGGGLGGVSLPIPFTHGTIRATVTIPGNVAGKDCQRNWRVEFFVHPFNAGRQGGTFYAGQHFSICHTNPETITFSQMNPAIPCSTYSVNAITGGVSQVEVEIIPP